MMCQVVNRSTCRSERWIAGDNNIVGSIPTEFGRCTKLLGLDLGQNFLNGTIPTQLGLLSAIGM
jgi:hypothetical protein